MSSGYYKAALPGLTISPTVSPTASPKCPTSTCPPKTTQFTASSDGKQACCPDDKGSVCPISTKYKFSNGGSASVQKCCGAGTVCYVHLDTADFLGDPFGGPIYTGDCCIGGQSCGIAPNQDCCNNGQQCVNGKCIIPGVCCLCLYQKADCANSYTIISNKCKGYKNEKTCKASLACSWNSHSNNCSINISPRLTCSYYDHNDCDWDIQNKKCVNDPHGIMENYCATWVNSMQGKCEVGPYSKPYTDPSEIGGIANGFASDPKNKCASLKLQVTQHGTYQDCPLVGDTIESCICTGVNCSVNWLSCSVGQRVTDVQNLAERIKNSICVYEKNNKVKNISITVTLQQAVVSGDCQTPVTLNVRCDGFTIAHFDCKKIPKKCFDTKLKESAICDNLDEKGNVISQTTFLCCPTSDPIESGFGIGSWALPINGECPTIVNTKK